MLGLVCPLAGPPPLPPPPPVGGGAASLAPKLCLPALWFTLVGGGGVPWGVPRSSVSGMCVPSCPVGCYRISLAMLDSTCEEET